MRELQIFRSVLVGMVKEIMGAEERVEEIERYYVSQALLQQRKEDAGSLPRLPAHDFEALISGRILEVLGADPRMKAALVKVGWNNDHDRQRLLRIIIKRIEVAQGVIRVQIDPAARSAKQQELDTDQSDHHNDRTPSFSNRAWNRSSIAPNAQARGECRRR